MLLICLSALGFSCMHGVIRHLSSELHPFELAFFRNLFGLLFLMPLLLRHGFVHLRTQRFRWHLARASLQVGAMMMFFSALSLSPLAQVSALSFTSPLFATVGAVLVLKEQIRGRRIFALLGGFLGAMVILRPGVVPIDLGALLVLASSAVWALTMLIIKALTRTDSSLTLTAYMGLIMTPLSIFPALFVWRWPGLESYLWLAAMGALGAASQLAMAEAFRGAETTAVLPFDYTRLIWASVIGFVVFGEVPGIWTWVGGTTIFASTTYIAYREAKASPRPSPGLPRIS